MVRLLLTLLFGVATSSFLVSRAAATIAEPAPVSELGNAAVGDAAVADAAVGDADVADAGVTVGVVDTVTRKPAFDLLTLYKDNYFLLGFSGKTQGKFQLSVKFDVWPNEGHHAVHFAYSQRSRWNLYDRSQPFAENNYSPELLYTYWNDLPRYEPTPGCKFARERVGAQHESNGESGSTSRGWNRIYAAARYACYADDHERYILGDLKAWAPPFFTKGNTDIGQFYGYGELAISIGRDGDAGWFDRYELTLRARKGTRDWGTGAIEIEAHYKLPFPADWPFTPHLVAQLFQGQGETLLRYDEVVTAFRVGVGFSDRSTRSR